MDYWNPVRRGKYRNKGMMDGHISYVSVGRWEKSRGWRLPVPMNESTGARRGYL